MQFHYVVGYDTDKNRWFVEYDTAAYFHDGNVWDDERFEAVDYGYVGWRFPDDGSDDEALDQDLLRTLDSIVDILPIPKEHENVTT